MVNKSSKEELRRYQALKLEVVAGVKANLNPQPELVANINGIDVFKYTADFSYEDLLTMSFVYEEYKGYIFERHDSLLRVKIMSALYPLAEFRIVTGKGLYRTYKAGKAVIQRKKKK